MHPSNTSRGRRFGQSLGVAAVVLLFSGCASYDAQTQQFAQATRSGSLATSIAQIDAKAKAATGGKDELVFRLEQGATLRSAALADLTQVPPPPAQPMAPQAAPVDPAAPAAPAAAPTWPEVRNYYLMRSITAFDQAEEKVNYWEEQSKVKVGSEIGAMVSNQASLPYRGRVYDKVMMNTYKALSYLELGEKDKARVELNRSLQRQRDAVAANEKRIAEAMKEAEMARNGELKDEKGKSASYDSAKALDDPKTGPALQAALNASIAPMKAYGDYVNPFSVFLDGLFFTVLGEGGSDLERGRKSFERVASMVPENPYLKADLDAASLAAEGKAPEGITYVIFETGTAPTRDQTRVDIPTFLVTSKLAYVGASFPKLQYNNDYIASLGVTVGDQTINTATVASIDSVVANDFKNEWPTIVTKTLITTATKAIIQATVQKQVSDNSSNPWAGLIAGAVMTVVNASTNIADTRTWGSLPKEFQYARLATPESRELTLTAGGVQRTVALEPGSVNVVYVKSASPTAPLFVSSFVLK